MRFRRDIGAAKRGGAKNVQNEAIMASEFIKKDAFKAFEAVKTELVSSRQKNEA